jgi:hypothetical protein
MVDLHTKLLAAVGLPFVEVLDNLPLVFLDALPVDENILFAHCKLYYLTVSDVYSWEVVLAETVHIILYLVNWNFVGHDNYQQTVQSAHTIHPERIGGGEDRIFYTYLELREDVAHGCTNFLALPQLQCHFPSHIDAVYVYEPMKLLLHSYTVLPDWIGERLSKKAFN